MASIMSCFNASLFHYDINVNLELNMLTQIIMKPKNKASEVIAEIKY